MKINNWGFKNDTRELVEVCQFLRETMPNIRVEREWYVLFDRDTGKYVGFTRNPLEDTKYKVRNPDIMIISKKNKGLLLCVEIDGSIHDVKVDETNERNEQYEDADIPLLPINKLEIETTLIDLVNRKVRDYMGWNE